MNALKMLQMKPNSEKTHLDNAVIFSRHGEIEKAAAQLSAYNAAINTLVMFLTNDNTIEPEAVAELIANLRRAGRIDLADAVAIGGFAAALKGGE
jgi:hypothetical protein